MVDGKRVYHPSKIIPYETYRSLETGGNIPIREVRNARRGVK